MHNVVTLYLLDKIKNPPVSAGDLRGMDLIPWSGRSAEGRHGNPLQDCCLKNLMDREVWQALVLRVTKSWALLK